MPNHVINRITGPTEVIDRICRLDENEQLVVDFEMVIPRPKAIVTDAIGMHVKDAAEIALGLIDFRATGNAHKAFSVGDYGAAARVLHTSNCTRQLLEGPHPKDFNDEDWKAFIGYLTAYRECGGLMDWYDWNYAMWGTKWNAYDAKRVGDGVVEFETAWSAPHPVLERLNELTKQGFKHEWADEDTGQNVGYRVYRDDGGFRESELSEQRLGYELAFDLRPGLADEYKLVGDTYEYIDPDEFYVDASGAICSFQLGDWLDVPTVVVTYTTSASGGDPVPEGFVLEEEQASPAPETPDEPTPLGPEDHELDAELGRLAERMRSLQKLGRSLADAGVAPVKLVKQPCPYDTNGDGDCHLCARHGGCEYPAMPNGTTATTEPAPAKWTGFNVNEKARVRLTDHGRELLRKAAAAFRSQYPHVTTPYKEPIEDANGWSEWQLWCLMEELGQYCNLGCTQPFHSGIQLLSSALETADV